MGRLQEKFTAMILLDFKKGKFNSNELMPAIRTLSDQYGVSRSTVKFGLDDLALKGYLSLIPKVGYRVKDSLQLPKKSGLIAFVSFEIKISDSRSLFQPIFMDRLQYFADQLAYSVVSISTNQKKSHEITNELVRMNVLGVIVSSYNRIFVEDLIKHNIPLVMLDSYIENLDVPTIIQDNFMGGNLAAKWVCKNKFENIIWFGPMNNALHALERYGGFVAGLSLNEQTIKPTNIINAEHDLNSMDSYVKKLRKCLETKAGSIVIVALWSNLAVIAFKLIKEMGLKYKKDIFIIGWCNEEMVESNLSPFFSKVEMPPYISWSCKQIASMTIDHFSNKSSYTKYEAIRKTVPVTLVE